MNINYSSLVTFPDRQNEIANSLTATVKENEEAAKQSLYKSYFNKLRENADEPTKKLITKIENSPADITQKLFSNIQETTVRNISQLFEDLKIKQTEELSSLIADVQADQIEKARQTDETDKTDETDETDKADEVDAADSTGRKDPAEESYLQKYMRESVDQIPADNERIGEVTEQMAKSAEKTKDAFKKEDEAVIDREKAYESAKEFVDSYNSLSDAIKDSQNGTVSGKAGFISEMLENYSERLEKSGVDRDEDGNLSINKQAFDEASDKDLERSFGEKDSFRDFIEGQSEQLAAYAQTDLYQKASSYSDAGNITRISDINGAYFNMLG